MKQKTLQTLIASALLASTSVAFAVPFNSFDPRSMAMGGAGVAVGSSSTAPFFNPALLTITHEDDLFSVDLPIVGARVYDPEDFQSSLDDFQNGNFINALQTSITTYNGTLTPANLAVVSTNVTTLSNQFATLSDKPIQGELGAGLVVGVPNKSFGAAFYANGWGAVGGVIQYKDKQTMDDLAFALDTVATCAVTPTLPVCSTITTDPRITAYISPTGQVTDITSSLLSNVRIRGVVLSEIGIALSTEFGVGNSSWGFGITPKLVRATLIDYSADINTGNTNNVDGDDYSAKYTGVNFDLGLAKDYTNGWRTGFVIKNIIPRSYDFKSIAPGAATGTAQLTTGTLKLRAQARVGASYSNSWSTVALDVDLTNNDPAGFESPSKYVALGAEFDAMGWAQLRVGYRADVRNSNRNVASVGVGISPFGVVHIDLAATGSANEVGGSARLAFTF